MAKRKYEAEPAWCPGCGDFPILKNFDKAIEAAGIDRRQLVLVSGIGQAAKLPHYTRANVFNGLHGRALPAATGIKLANHHLEVVITSGDGDMYGEGGNHFIHAIRRNISIKAFVHNNQVYGLTKGQASPTSDIGFVTKIQTQGVINQPLNPLALAIVEDCSFVARTFAGNPQHMQEMMVTALNHKQGFVLLDILQPCVSFNRVNTYDWYRRRVKPIDDSHDPYDRLRALELAFQWGDEIPIGIIYRSKRPALEGQIPVLKQKSLCERFNDHN
ncbi:MAG: 2-oxoacid:ferredoxin oxidoreductase subunit beta [Sedimentisphaerales bacterium]|nr:2-oxoacid:ferredoxin oxidoreductase subunit beta [Sedimentisphaerales bacterium]